MAVTSLYLNMTAAARAEAGAPDTPHPQNVGDMVQIPRKDSVGQNDALYLKFESIPSELTYKPLESLFHIYIEPKESTSPSSNVDKDVEVFVCSTSDFDPNTLTFHNRPAGGDMLMYQGGIYTASDQGHLRYLSKGWGGHSQVPTAREMSEFAKSFLKTSALLIYPAYDNTRDYFSLQRHYKSGSSWVSAAPMVQIHYDEDDAVSQVTPKYYKSGYVNPKRTRDFEWELLPNTLPRVCIGEFYQVSASFCWRVHNSGGYNVVPADGSTMSVTIPANTFPGGTSIDWFVTATDQFGHTSTSEVYTISTADTTTYATSIIPSNTVEDGSGPITFQWNLANAYGNQASRVQVAYKKPSASEWTILVDEDEHITSYDAPAGTFEPGEVQWRVRAFNQDGVAGPWDAEPPNTKSFVCVSAPNAPSSITSDGVPYATIFWQGEGQQAYEVIIDGKSLGVRFGTDKSITLDEPLSDGQHTVTIRTQGIYGLWSQPGTGVIYVTNVPGDEILLDADGETDAELTWTTEADVNNYFIYRDGIRIGHSSQKRFTDRLSLGLHSYHVLNRLPGGYYTRSNTVTVTTEATEPCIAEFPPKSWLSIRLTDKSNGTQDFSYQKTASARHFYGANWPIVETAPFDDATGSYNTAFTDEEEARAFEALRGKTVCIKSRRGMVFVGVMATLSKTVTRYFTAYNFRITRANWEDYIDDDTAG